MASLSRASNGTFSIQFIAKDKKRRTVRLGKTNKKTAEEIRTRIEYLAAAQIAGTAIDSDLARWLSQIGDELHDRLAGVGLVQPRRTATLGSFIREYIAGRTDIKEKTTENLDVVGRRLVQFLGPDKPLRDILESDAEKWLIWLQERYAPATIGRSVGRAKQFFIAAMRAKLIAENPFAFLDAPRQTNEKRKHFVSREVIDKVLEACPDAEWRLIVALCRYGGVRCPSEVLALRLEDVLWDRDRFLVRSCKTEHYEGKDERWTPLFPELRKHLEESFDLAEPGQTHFITRARGTRSNLRTRFTKIIRRAGCSPWPKLFHNLRASRETELCAIYPLHLVCKWLGNTAVIANAHYLTLRDEDFADAASGRGAKGGAVALQDPVQYGTVLSSTESQLEPQTVGAIDSVSSGMIQSDSVQCTEAPRTGLEPASPA